LVIYNKITAFFVAHGGIFWYLSTGLAHVLEVIFSKVFKLINAMENAYFTGSINAVRGGFTVKLMNLQALSLAWAHFGALNEYSFSYLIFIRNLLFLF